MKGRAGSALLLQNFSVEDCVTARFEDGIRNACSILIYFITKVSKQNIVGRRPKVGSYFGKLAYPVSNTP